MDLVPLAFSFAEDDACLDNNPKTLLVGSSAVAADEIDHYLATLLVRWNSKGMYLPIRHDAWREIPTVSIHYTADMTVLWDYQRNFVEEKAGRLVQTFELDKGHCPNLAARAWLKLSTRS
jgi:hypothetical protein